MAAPSILATKVTEFNNKHFGLSEPEQAHLLMDPVIVDEQVVSRSDPPIAPEGFYSAMYSPKNEVWSLDAVWKYLKGKRQSGTLYIVYDRKTIQTAYGNSTIKQSTTNSVKVEECFWERASNVQLFAIDIDCARSMLNICKHKSDLKVKVFLPQKVTSDRITLRNMLLNFAKDNKPEENSKITLALSSFTIAFDKRAGEREYYGRWEITAASWVNSDVHPVNFNYEWTLSAMSQLTECWYKYIVLNLSNKIAESEANAIVRIWNQQDIEHAVLFRNYILSITVMSRSTNSDTVITVHKENQE